MNRRSINLLTWRFRFFLLVRARLRQWGFAWTAVFLIMLGWWQLENDRLVTVMDRQAIMESRTTPLLQMQAENVQLARRVEELNSHQSLLTRLDDEQVPWRLLGVISQSVAGCDGALMISSFEFDQRQEPVPAVRTQSSSGTNNNNTGKSALPQLREVTELTLRGVANDNIAVSAFVGSLRDSAVFESVELVSSTGVDVQSRRTQNYLVKCLL